MPKGIEDPIILEKIEKSNLIERCIKFAEKGAVEKEVYAFHTSYYARNKLEELEVNFAEGVNSQGDGHIDVYDGKENVFYASVNHFAKNSIECRTPPLDITRSFVITKYIPGKWEDNL